MSDNVSVIDAIKVTESDINKMSDMVKGALHLEQIERLALMLDKAKVPPTDAAAAEAADSLRRAWKGANKATAKVQRGMTSLRDLKDLDRAGER